MSSETPTIKQVKAFQKTMENNGNISKSMRQVGYSKNTAKNPKILTESKGWETLMKKHIPDNLLAKKHHELLNSMEIGHMVFPVAVTDQEIIDLLATVNCTPQKFQHGDTANHVWYWARDNKAIKDALDMAYKLKRRYAEGGTNVNVNIIQGVEISFRE